MIRVVLDTNVLVSALFWGGQPLQILEVARSNRIHLVTSDDLITELKDVVSRPKFRTCLAQLGETPGSLLDVGFRALFETVQPVSLPPVVLDDPDDDAVLACALGGAADYIVSGDHHLLNLREYQGVPVFSVERFLGEILHSGS